MEVVELKIAFFVLFAIGLGMTQQVSLSSHSEKSALLDLRSSLGIKAEYWPKKADPCLNWTGIKCQGGRVIAMNLSGLRRTQVGRLNPHFSVDALGNFTRLSSFNSSGFLLPGQIPEWFGLKLRTLLVIDLSSCSVFGSVPPSLGNLGELKSLYLSGNSLTGLIPAALGKLYSLNVLDLKQNLLTGAIPSVLSDLRNLTMLDLSSNSLSGRIPSEFGLLSNLKFLRLQNNSLSMSIPAWLGNLSRLVEIDLGDNFLSGSLPEHLGRLKNLQNILIGNNQLRGALPERLFQNFSSVEYIVIRENRFEGKFPEVLLSMPHMRVLDVSGNKFTGLLTKVISINHAGTFFNFSDNLFYGNVTVKLNGISSIDLSINYFGGLVLPDNRKNLNITSNCFWGLPHQRNMVECRSFYAKQGLLFGTDDYAPNSLLNPLSGPSRNKRKLDHKVVGIVGGISLCGIVGFGLVLVLMIGKQGSAGRIGIPNVRHICLEEFLPTSPKFSGLGEAFSYEQILQATTNFSETNLLKRGHSGDFFHGTLEDGSPVTIKRVNLQFHNKESFNAELHLCSKIMQSRLVPLYGYCLEHQNEGILVYKYMPNGDLSNSLYRVKISDGNDFASLDWITRLKIATGTAEALHYLHHVCNPPLVHGDIQASSILLDDKYEVRLGSLSQVCAQKTENLLMITKSPRKPLTREKDEQGLSTAICAYDIYCFGKVSVELITGKLGISGADEDFADKRIKNYLPYISIHDKEIVSKIVDQSLIIDEDLLEEVWSVAIVAKACLNPKPWRRPLMKHVLAALENPFKVVREENLTPARPKPTSSLVSWRTFIGSWDDSAYGSANALGKTREINHTGREGSWGSGANECTSSHRRSSGEISPEQTDALDI